jgi:hypothetical protein
MGHAVLAARQGADDAEGGGVDVVARVTAVGGEREVKLMTNTPSTPPWIWR